MTTTPISSYQSSFFHGDIGEIISWNHVLTPTEVSGIDDYLKARWGFDVTPPIVTSANIASGTLIPKGTFSYTLSYTDTGSLIDTGSLDVSIYTWNTGTLAWNATDISSTYVTLGGVTGSTGTVNVTGLPFGKYRFDTHIADIAGNISVQSSTLFVDEVSLVISTPEYTIDDAPYGHDTFGSGELIVTVKTVGA